MQMQIKKEINKFDHIYQGIVSDIMQRGVEEMNLRTGHKTKALPGVCFSIDIQKDGFPLLQLRELKTTFIPEIMWMLSGKNNTEWLRKYTKIWDFFTEEDGTITSAYGYRWKHHFDVDQINQVIKKLEEDKSDRHGVVMMWSPKEDLLKKQKNVPCPVMFTVNIIANKLNLHLVMRSQDMILGFPTDVAGFALLQKIIAQKLNIKAGIFTISISNAHIYENQYYVAEELLKRKVPENKVKYILPKDSYKHSAALNDKFVNDLTFGIRNYKPLGAIKNIPIAI